MDSLGNTVKIVLVAVTVTVAVDSDVDNDDEGAFFLLGSELLAERCRTDDLLPSIPISCLPPCRMDPKVLRLNILINCSQPGCSWSSNASPPVCW